VLDDPAGGTVAAHDRSRADWRDLAVIDPDQHLCSRSHVALDGFPVFRRLRRETGFDLHCVFENCHGLIWWPANSVGVSLVETHVRAVAVVGIFGKSKCDSPTIEIKVAITITICRGLAMRELPCERSTRAITAHLG